jgi:hypothetical protein
VNAVENLQRENSEHAEVYFDISSSYGTTVME